MTDAEILKRASNAERLLNDPELQQAFETIRRNLLARFESLTVKDKEEILETKMLLTLLTALKANLQSVLDGGTVVIHRNSMLERAKRGINAFRN